MGADKRVDVRSGPERLARYIGEDGDLAVRGSGPFFYRRMGPRPNGWGAPHGEIVSRLLVQARLHDAVGNGGAPGLERRCRWDPLNADWPALRGVGDAQGAPSAYCALRFTRKVYAIRPAAWSSLAIESALQAGGCPP